MYRLLITCLALAGLPATGVAAEWSGKGELGAVLARGNSDTDAINAKLDVAREMDRWKHSAGASLLRTTNQDVVTANRWEARWQSDFKLSERSYAYAGARYEDDDFSPYAYQATLTAGYGYKWIDTAATRLSTQVGVGYKRFEPVDTGVAEGEAVFRGDALFEHQLTATTKVVEKFLVEAGADNTFLQNELGLEVKINAKLALGVGYAVRHNTEAPAGTEKTDQVTTVSLVYAF